VVGRPLAALLANDGARVFSVDVANIQEFTRRPRTSNSKSTPFLPQHVVRTSKLSLEDCLAASDCVITGVPSKDYKVPTKHLRDGVVAVNFSSEKNFESDIKEKVSTFPTRICSKDLIAVFRQVYTCLR
jgi:methylenetetrahydrofolate dehydrogenase (NAD+)